MNCECCVVPKHNHWGKEHSLFQINQFIWFYLLSRSCCTITKKSTNFVFFVEIRHYWPYRENSSCLVDEISLNFYLVHSLSIVIFRSVFMILMYNFFIKWFINLLKSLLETLTLKTLSIMRRFCLRSIECIYVLCI